MFATSAVKALIFCDSQFLVLSKPRWYEETGVKWNDLPGGRIDLGELCPKKALQRELKEELGRTDISIQYPIHMTTVAHGPQFQVVATVFLCETSSKEIILSQEHTDFCWVDPRDQEQIIAPWIRESIEK